MSCWVCYFRRATTRTADGAVARRQTSQTPKLASTQAAAAAPSVLPTGAPTANARPKTRMRARFTLNQTRTKRRNKPTRRKPRRTWCAAVCTPTGKSSHTGGKPSIASARSSRLRARSANSTLSANSASESRPLTKWRRSARTPRSRVRSPTSIVRRMLDPNHEGPPGDGPSNALRLQLVHPGAEAVRRHVHDAVRLVDPQVRDGRRRQSRFERLPAVPLQLGGAEVRADVQRPLLLVPLDRSDRKVTERVSALGVQARERRGVRRAVVRDLEDVARRRRRVRVVAAVRDVCVIRIRRVDVDVRRVPWVCGPPSPVR